jgi:hypothetical protein
MRPRSMIDLDAPRFTASDACTVAGIRPATLKSWLSREPAIILLRKSDQPATGADHRHLLTLRRVFQIALTAELMRRGVTTQRAGNLAALFTDHGGERPAAWHSNPDHAHRLPGHLFPNGSTVLVANKDRFGPIVSAVTNIPIVDDFTRHNSNVLVVNVDEMVDRVLAALRLTEQGTAPADQVVGSCRPLLGIRESSEDQQTAVTLGATGGLDGFNSTPASGIATLAAG